MDTYFGSQKFTGGERVWIRNHAVWAMNYYGQSLNENFDIAFLKEALSHVFECFSGEERIYCRQEKVYASLFYTPFYPSC